MLRRIQGSSADNREATRREFLKKCGVAAIAAAGGGMVLGTARDAAAADPVWSPIPTQVWDVDVPVLLDLTDYCSQGPPAVAFSLDEPLPPGVTLVGSVISGAPTEPFPATHFIAYADTVTGIGSEPSAPPGRPWLTAFPNPTSGPVLFLGQRRSTLESSGTLRIFSVSGRLVYQRAVTVSGDRYEIRWEGRSTGGGRVSSGVYVAVVQAGSEAARTRLVVTE